MTACLEDAEDLTQDTFFKIQKNLSSFRGESSIKTWIFTIATNLAKNHFKSYKSWPLNAQDKSRIYAETSETVQRELIETIQNGEHTLFEIKEHIDFCFTCIMKTLPLKQQIALMLKEIYDFEVKEIEHILKESNGVIKHLLHNARSTLRNIYENRCSLINKKGVCYQCKALNEIFNKNETFEENTHNIKLINEAPKSTKEHLLFLRIKLIKAINPLNAKGVDLHDFLLKTTKESISQLPD